MMKSMHHFKKNLKNAGIAMLVGLPLVVACQQARADQTLTVSFKDLMNMPATQSALNPSVSLYFGQQLYPSPVKQEGSFYFTERNNKVFTSTKAACRNAGLAALKDLQQRASDMGANAVTDIVSYHNKQSGTDGQYECSVGTFTVEATLKGRMSILKG